MIKKLLWVLLLLIPLTITAAPTQSGTEFAWNAPTQNTDDSLLTDLAGFKLYCGAQSRTYTLAIGIDNPAQVTLPIASTNIPDGDWYCAITAYNTEGLESQYSNEYGPFTISGGKAPVIVPAAPSGFRVQ
jgi:hypothetical protein